MSIRRTICLLAVVSLSSTAWSQETAGPGRLSADHILDWERVADPQILDWFGKNRQGSDKPTEP